VRHLELVTEAGLATRLSISSTSLRKRSDVPAPILLGGRKRWFLSDVEHLFREAEYSDSVTGDELGALLGCSVSTIYKWVQAGKLPPGRRGRWSRADVESFLRALPRRKDGRKARHAA
jgi:excisionase family DNA binding protein